MKKIIDINKLVTFLVEGYQQYTDGRHPFSYELLVRTLKDEAGITVDNHALDDELERRCMVRRGRMVGQHTEREWVLTFNSDPDKHFDALFSSDSNDRTYETWKFSCSNDQGRWRYSTWSRELALEMFKYIKRYHPDYNNMKFEMVKEKGTT